MANLSLVSLPACQIINSALLQKDLSPHISVDRSRSVLHLQFVSNRLNANTISSRNADKIVEKYKAAKNDGCIFMTLKYRSYQLMEIIRVSID